MAYTMEEFVKLDIGALHAGEKKPACACGDPAGESGKCHYCEMGELIERHPIGRPGAVPPAPRDHGRNN